MIWTIEFSTRAEKALHNVDKSWRVRIAAKIDELNNTLDPRSSGKPLRGNLAGLWRWRVGDYRIIAEVNDYKIIIFIVDIEHRSKVYRSR